MTLVRLVVLGMLGLTLVACLPTGAARAADDVQRAEATANAPSGTVVTKPDSVARVVPTYPGIRLGS